MMEYRTLRAYEAFGSSYGQFGLKIEAMLDREPTDEERIAAIKASDLIEDAVMRARIRRSPTAQAEAAEERKSLLSLFGEAAIFVEEIPNRYCPR